MIRFWTQSYFLFSIGGNLIKLNLIKKYKHAKSNFKVTGQKDLSSIVKFKFKSLLQNIDILTILNFSQFDYFPPISNFT